MYLQILKFSYTVLPRVLIRNLFKLIELFHIKKFLFAKFLHMKKKFYIINFKVNQTKYNLYKLNYLSSILDRKPNYRILIDELIN